MSTDGKITLDSRLGFIGLGLLGSRIAYRLASAGFHMVVYERNVTHAIDLRIPNAKVAKNPGELAGEVDVVLSCLPHELAVQEVYFGAVGVLDTVRPGTQVIELSTISPDTSRQLYRAARKRDVPALDVAVSGSTSAAEAGKLTLFGGGDREVFEAAKPILQAIASQWFYVGKASVSPCRSPLRS
jgi:3-hydroxyisobutyrate dehydrogenase